MPKPVLLKVILQTLKRKGFFFVRQKGSHARFEKVIDEKTYKVTVVMTKKEVPYGTFYSILIHSGLKESDFKKKRRGGV